MDEPTNLVAWCDWLSGLSDADLEYVWARRRPDEFPQAVITCRRSMTDDEIRSIRQRFVDRGLLPLRTGRLHDTIVAGSVDVMLPCYKCGEMHLVGGALTCTAPKNPTRKERR